MSSPSIRSPARPRRRSGFIVAWMALLWLGVIALAIVPFPWW